jgi:arabinofuranan 3-O-arabinosyltransferase
VVEDSPTNITADVRGAQTPYWFVSGVPVDARWHASLDGQDLGAPAALDGGTAAWRITAVGDHRISVNYEPQRIALLTRAISLAALLGCFLLAFARRRPLAGSSPIEFTDSLPNPRWLASMSRMTRISTRSLHRCFEALGFVVAFGLLGGPAFLPVGVALAVFHLWIRPRAKLYLKAAVALFALVPFMWIIGNIDHADLISPELVSGNLWPSRLALVGVVLLTMGVICDDREVVDEHPA